MKDKGATIKAYPSGEVASSGRIVTKEKGQSKEISALIFSESEIERLFNGITVIPLNLDIEQKSKRHDLFRTILNKLLLKK